MAAVYVGANPGPRSSGPLTQKSVLRQGSGPTPSHGGHTLQQGTRFVDIIFKIVDFVMHVDVYLNDIIARYGEWTLAVLFVVIFFETGVVVTPFLPGDSLIFAAATFAARGVLNPVAIFVLLSIAAIAGDTANYWIGHR